MPGYESSSAARQPDDNKGFWEALGDFFLPDEDRYAYAEGLRRGGYLVSLTVDDAMYETALDVLDDEGTIDMDEREAGWRSEGWQGYKRPSSAGRTSSASTARSSMAGARGTSGAASEEETVVPVVEEQLRVGKRDTSSGRVRVRSYVVEQPVSEDVRLREESVVVERRPTDRTPTEADRVFQDRSIDVEEHREEAVVQKEARVKEEVVVKKQVGERMERVTDTIRRTEVEVEDDRAGRRTRRS
jgi:uncharacterized protein (TIGR02271 family)